MTTKVRGASSDSSTITCYYCKEPGHIKHNCRKLQNKQQWTGSANVASSTEDVTMPAAEYAKLITKYQESLALSSSAIPTATSNNDTALVSSSKWVIDSGTTDHTTGSYDEAD